MRNFITSLIICLLIVPAAISDGCKKNLMSSAGGGGTDTGSFASNAAAVTDTGQVAGISVTKTIGPSGGTIVSSDGEATLVIPAGALAANTTITVVPITNQMPGGMGLAYNFLPNGLKFLNAATLTIHYNLTGGMNNYPDAKYIAYQDSAGRWKGNLVDRDYDTVAHTISLDITHFTRWASADGFIYLDAPVNLHAGESVHFNFQVTGPWDDPRTTIVNGAAQMPQTIEDKYIGPWYVNEALGGNATDGTAEGNRANCVYHAPLRVDAKRLIVITTTIRIPERRWKKGKPLGVIQAPLLGFLVNLVPNEDYNYAVTISVLDSTISGNFYKNPLARGVPNYYDQVKLGVHIHFGPGLTADVDTANFAPSTTQAVASIVAQNGVLEETFTWIPDDYGELNVQKVSLSGQGMPADSILFFVMTHSNTFVYGFKDEYFGLNGAIASTSITNPQPWPGSAQGIGAINEFTIDLKKGSYFTDDAGYGMHNYFIVTKQ